MEKFNSYTGTLTYRGIAFFFAFDGKELRLFSSAENLDKVQHTILMEKIGDTSIYTMAFPTMEKPYLIGKCNETSQTIIFLTKKDTYIGTYNEVLFVKIVAYILFEADAQPISKVSFKCPELNYIHPISQGYSWSFEDEQLHHGIVSVQTENFDATTTAPKTFQLDGKEISVNFEVARSFSRKLNQPPLAFHSTMSFRFEPIEEYTFIAELWSVAKEFLQFMCYRKNVFLPEADLSTPTAEDKTRNCATFYMIDEIGNEEPETLQNGRYIKLAYLSGKEGLIMNDIVSRRLYTRHIPDTYSSGCHINAARFIMITSAFEWEFKRLYPDGVRKTEKTLAVENKAVEEIQKLIENSSGELKHKFKFLQKRISDTSLQSEIIHVGNELGDILNVFGQKLYSLNDTKLIYSEMGKRLADQRNNYAHGNLDIDFINRSLIDLIYTERIIYAMQLKLYGIETKNIQKAINELFQCRFFIC